MIVVKVELHSAVTGDVTEIGRMTIANDGTGDKKRSNYDIKLMRRGTTDTIQREGKVLDHTRSSSPIWALVRKALKAVNFQ